MISATKMAKASQSKIARPPHTPRTEKKLHGKQQRADRAIEPRWRELQPVIGDPPIRETRGDANVPD
jgi:hypothetical protein